jgi:hypothetical protein
MIRQTICACEKGFGTIIRRAHDSMANPRCRQASRVVGNDMQGVGLEHDIFG